MKIPVLKITTLLFILFLASGLNAQTRFGKIECDSFQVTVDESEAIVYQENKAAVYNGAKQEFLIKPTKASIIFFPVDNYYLKVNKKEMTLYNFHCTDTIAPCIIEYQADSSLFFNTTSQGKITMIKDGFNYGVFPNFHLKTEWSLFRSNERYPNSTIRSDVQVNPFKSVGVERLNDSLILVTNYKWDYDDPSAGPIKSVQYPEDDSITYDPVTGAYFAIYAGPDPGYEYCGVYDLNAKKWMVSPTKLIEFYSENGIMFQEVFRYGNYGIDSSNLSLMNFKGEFLFEEIDYFNRYESNDIVRLLCGADTVLRSPYFLSYLLNPGRHVNIVKNGKMALINTGANFHPTTKFKDFMYYNADYGYYFWLENDSIFDEINGAEYVVSQSQGVIEVYPEQNWESFNYSINLIEKDDTVRHKILSREMAYVHFCPPLKIRIEIIQGDLILNDTKNNEATNIKDLPNAIRHNPEGHLLETYDASSVWRKTTAGWTKMIGNCKSIKKVKFGYLLSNQYFYKSYTYSSRHIYKPTFFALVDSNFKTMEFHGTSVFTNVEITEKWIELATEHGSFLIDHQGQPIISKN